MITIIPNNGVGLTVRELEQALDLVMQEANRLAKLLEERRQQITGELEKQQEAYDCACDWKAYRLR